jgi:hypothetical protein
VFDKQGNVRANRLQRLIELVNVARSYDITVDLTMAASRYDHPVAGQIGAQLTAAKALAATFKGDKAIAFIDLGNEHEQAMPGQLTPAEYDSLASAVLSSDPARALTGSISGTTTFIADKYAKLLKGSKHVTLLAPHFPRKSGWGANEGPNANTLRNLLKNQHGIQIVPPIYLQEPARNGYNNQFYPASEFIDADKSAQAAKTMGLCLHTDAGFDLSQKSLMDQLDPEELKVLDYYHKVPL